MSGKKHLVLDDDVYLKLKQHKGRTKLSAKTIGNSILRSGLAHPSLTKAIGKQLLKMGKLSQNEYEQVVAEALREIAKPPAHALDVIKPTGRETFISGSWEFKEIQRSMEGAFQIFEGWARDKKKISTSPHFHRAYDYLIVLEGKVQFTTGAESKILEPREFLSIPPGQVHSSRPLTGDTRIMVITTPAELECSRAS